MRSISVRVPASTSNLGPGFDTLGLALKLYNTVTVSIPGNDDSAESAPPGDMILETLDFCRERSGLYKLDWDNLLITITGDIPISRGLGSSVTVRLGILLGITSLAHHLGYTAGVSRESVLDWVIELEGHPDNAVPSCLGGFGVCSRTARGGFGYTRAEVSNDLQWVALVPNLELSTEAARRMLPKEVDFRLAVENVQNTARLAVCLATGRYAELQGLFRDHFHQPYRQILIPGFQDIIATAEESGALGGFLSGAGSTLMAVVLKSRNNPHSVAEAMLKAAQKNGLTARTIILEADNEGAKIV